MRTRQILEEVASGRLRPEEAAALLDAAEREGDAAAAAGTVPEQAGAAPGEEGPGGAPPGEPAGTAAPGADAAGWATVEPGEREEAGEGTPTEGTAAGKDAAGKDAASGGGAAAGEGAAGGRRATAGDAAGAGVAGEDAATGTLRRVRVAGTFRTARVIGDPGVREAVARGQHSVHREGDTLVIRGEEDEADWTFNVGVPFGLRWPIPTPRPPGPPPRPGRPGAPGRQRQGDWGWGGPPFRHRLPELEVRLNPELALDVELWAGTLLVTGVKGPLDVDVSAGSARVVGFNGPLDVKVAAGSVHASGVLAEGASRVRCEAGRVHVHLERGSSVRVQAKADLGRVSLPGDEEAGSWSIGSGPREVVVGDGAASLDVEAAMGNVTVSVDG